MWRVVVFASRRVKLSAAIFASAAFLAFSGTAQSAPVTIGDILVTLGNPQPNETMIYLDGPATTTTGTGHVGSQSGDPGTPLVTFTTNVNAEYANGFANITGTPTPNGVFTSLTVSVPTGWFFTDLEFSTLKANQVTATAMNGLDTIGTYSNDALGNGLVAWLVEAQNGKVFTSLVLTSTDGFTQVKQVEISGLAATPLPSALPLFAGGLGVLGLFGWRRKRKRAIAS